MAELNDDYIARMEDVLALYERPYNAAEPVVYLDEKPVSLHDEVRQGRPALPGHIAKRVDECKRCGVANVFDVVEPQAGRHFNRVTPNRLGAPFAREIAQRASTYRYTEKIHLVLDNLSTHSLSSSKPSETRRGATFGVGSRFTGLRSMAVGSIRLRSN